MSLWKEPAPPAASGAPRPLADPPPRPAPERVAPPAAAAAGGTVMSTAAGQRESVIAAGLSIEGKIQGTGNVRISGAFKGDVHVEGNLSIDPGAKHHGEVRAGSVTVSGELTGNIGAKHVDVTPTGVIVGDVKAATITVASGSRMRGHVEFGWGDGSAMPTRVEPKGSGLPS